ncbi:Vacuolar protein sorting-associated protein 72 [Coemansia sp. RSA 1939]|nr:Vacuolar protein sorting-associated protein 72 [Coemansia sp. RSA 1939]KAJ2677908.1 Vacuolar protein sorting-associated protein 72 [Coemansia sp. RSA 1285]
MSNSLSKRSRRSNAGNKMRAMVEEARAKIQSGETADSDEDADYDRGAGDLDDIVDSDFEDTDSEAEQAADDASKEIEALIERSERKRKRKLAKKQQRIVPRFAAAAVSAPKRQIQKSTTDKESLAASPASTTITPAPDICSSENTGEFASHKQKKPDFPVRFSSRAVAVRKAQETEALVQERDLIAAVKRKKRKTLAAVTTGDDGGDETSAELTQEQLLEEAKRTEIENLEKLNEFQQLEAEEKRMQRMSSARQTPLIIRPVVHWKSFSRACSRQVLEPSGKSTDDGAIIATTNQPSQVDYSLEHTDSKHYPLDFWNKNLSIVPPKVCPITGLPARYFHPRAKVPYANLRAYRVLEDMMRGEYAYFYDIDVWSSTDVVSNCQR